jgi:hypothetical protein
MGEYGMMLMVVIDNEHSDQQQSRDDAEQHSDAQPGNEYGSCKSHRKEQEGG